MKNKNKYIVRIKEDSYIYGVEGSLGVTHTIKSATRFDGKKEARKVLTKLKGKVKDTFSFPDAVILKLKPARLARESSWVAVPHPKPKSSLAEGIRILQLRGVYKRTITEKYAIVFIRESIPISNSDWLKLKRLGWEPAISGIAIQDNGAWVYRIPETISTKP